MSKIPTPAEITLREVFDLLTEVRDDVQALKSSMTDVRGDVADHETRIRGLERAIWKAMGFAAAIGASGGWLASTFLP